MRIVLDTNVLVAAFIAHGNCNELLEHCIVHHEVVLSEFILEELLDVLNRKFDFTQIEARDVSVFYGRERGSSFQLPCRFQSAAIPMTTPFLQPPERPSVPPLLPAIKT